MEAQLLIDRELDPNPCLPALVWAEGISMATCNTPLPPFVSGVVQKTREKGAALWPDDMKTRVRKMLKNGKYRASGRGKPASEFLLGAALKGSFPSINCPVDVNNAISLESGLPGSIFDVDRSGIQLLLRHGKKGENYIFNPSGQTIDLEDLLLVCRKDGKLWQPCGNPVKDSMSTKTGDGTRNVIAVIYAPAAMEVSELEFWAGRYAGLLAEHCRAASTGFSVISPGG